MYYNIYGQVDSCRVAPFPPPFHTKEQKTADRLLEGRGTMQPAYLRLKIRLDSTGSRCFYIYLINELFKKYCVSRFVEWINKCCVLVSDV